MILPPQAWIFAVPSITSVEGSRTAAQTRQVIDQFDVEHSERYRKGHDASNPTETYCSTFVEDVSRAMGCPINHWVDANGEPVAIGKGSELNANRICDWLEQHGAAHGYSEVDLNQATIAAARGEPVIACWKHLGGPGHVVVCSASDAGELVGTQAGATNFTRKPLAYSFGKFPFKLYHHR